MTSVVLSVSTKVARGKKSMVVRLVGACESNEEKSCHFHEKVPPLPITSVFQCSPLLSCIDNWFSDIAKINYSV